jgi:hypothetical protein
MVLSVMLGLVFGVAQLLGRSSSGDDEPAKATTVGAASARTSPTPPVSTADARPGADDKKRRKQAKQKKTETPLPEPTGPCADDDIVVTPEVVGTAYAVSPVTMRLNITTVSSPACTWHASPRTLAVKLVSGSDRIWSTQDCPSAVPDMEVVARKEKAAVVDVTWRGQRSDSSCSKTTRWALPGWYHIQAAAFGAEPTDVQFELLHPVAKTITPTPKPDKRDKKAEKPRRQT